MRGEGLPIGLHLNLARWAPVSKLDAALLTHGELDEKRVGELPVASVQREIDAQLERLETLLGQSASHLDVHKHLHQNANVLEALCRAALEHRLPVRSIDVPMRETFKRRGIATNDAFIGDAGSAAYWSYEQLERSIAALPGSGVVELMCHPGHEPKLIASGYGRQREVELTTFTSPTARALLERRDLIPTSWNVFRAL